MEGPRVFDPTAWRLFARYFRGRRVATVVCLGAALCQSVLPLPMIPIIRLIFDRAIPRNDLRLLFVLGAGLAAVRLLNAALVVFTRARLVDLKTAIVLDLRRDLLAQLYERPSISHARAENQPLLTHIVIDAERVDGMLDMIIANVLAATFTCVVLGVAMVFLSAQLVMVGLVLVPVVALVGRLTARRIRTNFSVYHRAHDAFVRGVRFALDNFALTRSRGAEAEETARQLKVLHALRDATRAGGVDNVVVLQMQSLVVISVGVVMLVIGGGAVARHAMTVGSLLAFFAAAGFASSQIDRLINALPAVIEGSSALARLHAHLVAPAEPAYRGKQILDWDGAVALEGVEFSYGEGVLLRDVSLSLAPGANVGLVGSNGVGKTTILSLILGLYRPDAGRLTADGVAYDELDIPALRRSIGLVEQHPIFFNGTVFENVSYGAPRATREEVSAIFDRVGGGALLKRLPGGLDAPLGEGGLLLSGGQRQMIAVVRALAIKPRLLILDEPTNHLDLEAMTALIAALRASRPRPTMLLISHDPMAMAGLDALYRLEAGSISLARRDWVA